MMNAFTVDVEDYFHVSAFDNVIPRETWGDFESRVVRNTHQLLDLLAAGGIRGTFFVLGWVAERFPDLVKEIHSSGHELACHGYWHHLIYTQSPDEFRNDVRRAKRIIEDTSGQKVVAYRAPSFSITRKSMWALNVLVEEGFEVDSSIFPARHDRYGIPAAKRHIHQIATDSGAIWEFPLAVLRLARLTLPISGGGYFRLFPFSFTRRALALVNGRGQPFSFYIHPWELDAEQPRVRTASRLSRFRHYVNLHGTRRKLERLIASFRFGTISDVIRQHASSADRSISHLHPAGAPAIG